MKILDDKRPPNPRRVRIFLAEKGITVRYEQVDIMKGEHKNTAFADVNPMQRVPVLILDDGTAISETMAICRYFEALHPEPSLFGKSALDIARIEMWNRRTELSFLLTVAQCVRHGHPALAVLESSQVPDWAAANRPRVIEAMDIFNRSLEKHEFIAGDAYSVADITALTATDFMKLARIAIPDHAVHFKRWYAAVSARPSASA